MLGGQPVVFECSARRIWDPPRHIFSTVPGPGIRDSWDQSNKLDLCTFAELLSEAGNDRGKEQISPVELKPANPIPSDKWTQRCLPILQSSIWLLGWIGSLQWIFWILAPLFPKNIKKHWQPKTFYSSKDFDAVLVVADSSVVEAFNCNRLGCIQPSSIDEMLNSAQIDQRKYLLIPKETSKITI